MKRKYLVGFAVQLGSSILVYGTRMYNKIIEYGNIEEKDLPKIKKLLYKDFNLGKDDKIILLGITPLPLLSKK